MVVGSVWNIEVSIVDIIVGGISNLIGSGNVCVIPRFLL